MRLKKLELIGFKSFADKTVFDFEGSITALVGPNGSGKSNVVDALKWVLGERSARKLRGNEMADMIFNGSSSRAALGTAEVRVTLDNSSGMLPVDFEEVTISRCCYRSGESDYSMNGKKCRLKDIRDLLMDTGVGVSAYSFIEQGQVDRLLQASSSERREVLEEAAGINQYLERKKEAERKLDRVRDNLQRVTDIVDELDRQLKSVRRQAAKARRYKRYTDELERLRLALGVRQKRTLKRNISSLQEKIEEKTTEQERLESRVDSRKSELSKAEEKLEKVRGKLSNSEDRLSDIAARQYSLKREIEINRKRQKELRERCEELQQRREKVEESLSQVKEEIEETERKVEDGQRILESRREEYQKRSSRLDEMKGECDQLEKKAEEGKSEVFNLMQKESQVQNEISMIRSEQDTLRKRVDRKRKREKEIQSQREKLKEERKAKTEKLAELRDELGEHENTLTNLESTLTEEKERVDQLETRLGDLRADLQGKRSRQQVLQDLQDSAEGIGSGVQELMDRIEGEESCLSGCPGLVANMFEVGSEDALAVEAAVGHLVQAVAVENPEQAAEALDLLRDGGKGRANVLPMKLLRENDPVEVPVGASDVERLIDLVDCSEEENKVLQHLVADCLVVEDADHALSLLEDGLPEGARVVTRAGDCISPEGAWAAGEPESGSLISRRSELAELADEINEMEKEVTELKEERSRRVERIEDLLKEKNELRTKCKGLESSAAQIQNDVSVLESKQEERQEESEVIDGEIESLNEDIEKAEERLEDKRADLERVGEKRQERQEELDGLRERVESQKEQREDVADELSELKSELGRIEEQQKSRRDLARRLNKQLEQRRNELKRIKREREDSQEQIEEAAETIRSSIEERETLEEEKEDLESRVENRSEKCDATRQKIQSLREQLEELSSKRHRVDKAVQKLRMKENENQVKLENLYERVREESDIDLKVLELRPEHWEQNPLYFEAEIEEYYEEPEAEPETVAEWYQEADPEEAEEDEENEVKLIPLEEAAALREEVMDIVGDEDTDWEELADRRDELRRKVDNMGGANLDAIDEQDELEERAEFLKNQQEDLEEARQHELEIIRELSRKSRENFLETFNKVREKFQELVRKLFGGGSGDIMLDDEADDVLDAGIEIKVQPPGKENRSITLLSGGEKALAAVALLFSIFESKPSPFCLLDEVDAPLDEANVGRFLGMLEEYSEDTQFVMVTHNKTTMSAAETLYGISLQEDGVSKKVAVNFEDVDNKLEEMTRETRMAEMRAKAG